MNMHAELLPLTNLQLPEQKGGSGGGMMQGFEDLAKSATDSIGSEAGEALGGPGKDFMQFGAPQTGETAVQSAALDAELGAGTAGAGAADAAITAGTAGDLAGIGAGAALGAGAAAEGAGAAGAAAVAGEAVSTGAELLPLLLA